MEIWTSSREHEPDGASVASSTAPIALTESSWSCSPQNVSESDSSKVFEALDAFSLVQIEQLMTTRLGKT